MMKYMGMSMASQKMKNRKTSSARNAPSKGRNKPLLSGGNVIICDPFPHSLALRARACTQHLLRQHEEHHQGSHNQCQGVGPYVPGLHVTQQLAIQTHKASHGIDQTI